MARIRHLARRVVDQGLANAGRLVPGAPLPSLINGTLFWLDRDSWSSVYATYEPYMVAAIRQHLHRGGAFYDIGAHFGLWTLFGACVVGKTGHVLACEPSDAFDVLEKNSRRFTQIRRLRIAVGDRDVQATFYGQGLSSAGSLSRAVTEINAHFAPTVPLSALDVRVRPLDAVSAEVGRDPDVIKVDVEGYELKVLEGAASLIARAHPTWLIEIHPPQLLEAGGTDQDCLRLLRKSGYAVKVINRNPNSLYTILAERS